MTASLRGAWFTVGHGTPVDFLDLRFVPVRCDAQ
jgi:hypothetical protein